MPAHIELNTQLWSNVIILGLDECWEWRKSKDKWGYGLLNNYGVRKVHRVSFELTHGVIPEDMQVLHKCDNPSCCNPTHLFLGTNYDNVQDKVKKNRQTRGELVHTAKLNPEQVVEIRRLYATEEYTMRALAKKFNIDCSVINGIVHYKYWKSVKEINNA